jgi:hypothetical protein
MMINFTEKTMGMMNEGGMYKLVKGEKSQEKKSAGGILFHYIKTEGNLTRDQYKELFKRDYKARNEKRKLIKKIDKLLL